MNPAAELLADLRKRGLHVSSRGSELLVGPRSALSDELLALIRAHKLELLQAISELPADLERRIRSMATRWQYTDADLADVLERARRDPGGWTRVVALDEEREAEFRARGSIPQSDT